MMPKKNYIDADEKYVRNYTLYAPTDAAKQDNGMPAKLYFDPECTKRLKDGDLLKKMFDVGLHICFADTNDEIKATHYDSDNGGMPAVGYTAHCVWAGNTWNTQYYGTWPNLED